MILQGRLLVATPSLGDPNFSRTVVLIAEHGPEGAMGLVLNRPLGVSVADAVPILSDFVPDDESVHAGGPVQPEAVMALGDFVDGNRAAAIAFDSVGFLPADADETLDPTALLRTRVFAGYAGWGPGQLEGEIDEEAWLAVPARTDDCFTADPNGLWRDAIRRHGGEFAVFALEPDDPTLN